MQVNADYDHPRGEFDETYSQDNEDNFMHYGKVDTILEAEEMDEETPASKFHKFKNTLGKKLHPGRSKES